MKGSTIIALVTALLLTTAPAAAGTHVAVEGGRIEGVQAGGVNAFRGIPYAAPPVGGLRWRPPAPPATWDGVRKADRFGPDCMQNPLPGAKPAQPPAEDCLYLNVWAPDTAGADGRPLPVLVWVPGGGFVTDSAANPVMDGAGLAGRGLVVVTFNYRLGRFGFFAHPDLTAESGDGPTGNWGFMDQIAALHWVQRNIAAFGGDPANITFIGESAGGESVARLMASSSARGLFQKAAVISGGGRDAWPGLAAAEARGVAFAKAAGAADGVAGLRALPADKVRGGITLLDKEEKTYSGPITDGRIIDGELMARFAAGAQPAVPLIVGANDDEFSFVPGLFRMFLNGPHLKAVEINKDAVQAAYGSAGAMRRSIASDVVFVEPSVALARRHAAAGAPTWLYRFGYVAEAKREKDSGAGHATDMPYHFETLGHAGDEPAPADRATARLMADLWARFAKTGDPNGGDLPAWPRYDAARPQMLSIGVETKAVSAAEPVITAITAAREATP
ncbi:carboxylesterase/lipase family protein [Niveispirillum fermenti]|uniref:carboxylesterase/lipase family protein n=1 Tax=Niveispirillum fermenti TaxID=1233113 RepID=UPI003A88D516